LDPIVFFHMKPTKILIALNDKSKSWYAALLAKEADCTYAHTIKILGVFSAEGLVIFDRQGRVKRTMITDKGSSLARDLETVVLRLEKPDQASDSS